MKMKAFRPTLTVTLSLFKQSQPISLSSLTRSCLSYDAIYLLQCTELMRIPTSRSPMGHCPLLSSGVTSGCITIITTLKTFGGNDISGDVTDRITLRHRRISSSFLTEPDTSDTSVTNVVSFNGLI